MELRDLLIWVFGTSLSIIFVVWWNRIRPGPLMTREEHLETEIQHLSAEVSSLQTTIKLLSQQISTLEAENLRLRNLVFQVLRDSQLKRPNTNVMRLALEKLSSGEVTQLAFDHFREVSRSFSDEQTLLSKRQALLEYAENHNEVSKLYYAIITLNPAAFDLVQKG